MLRRWRIWLRTVMWLVDNYDVFAWVSIVILECNECDKSDYRVGPEYCEQHQRLVDKMVNEARNY